MAEEADKKSKVETDRELLSLMNKAYDTMGVLLALEDVCTELAVKHSDSYRFLKEMTTGLHTLLEEIKKSQEEGTIPDVQSFQEKLQDWENKVEEPGQKLIKALKGEMTTFIEYVNELGSDGEANQALLFTAGSLRDSFRDNSDFSKVCELCGMKVEEIKSAVGRVLGEEIIDNEKKIEQLKQEIEMLMAKKKSLVDALKQKQTELKSHVEVSAIPDDVKKILQSHPEKLQSIVGKLQGEHNFADKLREEIERLNTEITQLEAEIKNLNQQLEAAKEKVKKKEGAKEIDPKSLTGLKEFVLKNNYVIFHTLVDTLRLTDDDASRVIKLLESAGVIAPFEKGKGYRVVKEKVGAYWGIEPASSPPSPLPSDAKGEVLEQAKVESPVTKTEAEKKAREFKERLRYDTNLAKIREHMKGKP